MTTTRRHPKLGSVISFDPNAYPFASLFLDRVRSLASDLTDLALLHELVPPTRMNAVYDALYSLVRESSFRQHYRRLVEKEVGPFFDKPFRYQRVPGIRIHTPSSRTVQYHSDYWYGHGPDVLNFWMPITRSFGTNALHVATLESSLREIDEIVDKRMRQPEIDERLKTICEPVELDFGTIRVFNAQTAHGTLQNDTDKTRISVDFRILMDGCDAGSKDPREYYMAPNEPDVLAAGASGDTERTKVGSYIFPKHGYTRFLPASSQRAVVESYAHAKHLQIITEETEIFPMTHHPTLLNLAAGKGTDPVKGVLLFSVLCLPEDASIRSEIYATAQRTGTTLYFANENLVFPLKDTTADIESARRRAQD